MQRLDSQPALVEFSLYGQKRPAFHLSMAREVHSESRPKNHANPGRADFPDLPYPATRPLPSSGSSTIPCTMLIRAQSYACCSSGAGTSMEVVWSRNSL